MASGSLTQDVRFPGQLEDSETALNQNWHREYDPMLGRYVQSDPIGLIGGVNTYAYVEGNPLRRVDPEGLRKLPFPLNSRICNYSSDQCVASYSDGVYQKLQPGQYTSFWKDDGDFAHFGGEWFKCSAATCFIDSRGPGKYSGPFTINPVPPGDYTPPPPEGENSCGACQCPD